MASTRTRWIGLLFISMAISLVIIDGLNHPGRKEGHRCEQANHGENESNCCNPQQHNTQDDVEDVFHPLGPRSRDDGLSARHCHSGTLALLGLKVTRNCVSNAPSFAHFVATIRKCTFDVVCVT